MLFCFTGSVLRHLEIYGSDNQISVTEKTANPNVVFDPISRNLTLIKPLDAEQGYILDVQLQCLIKATSQRVRQICTFSFLTSDNN